MFSNCDVGRGSQWRKHPSPPSVTLEVEASLSRLECKCKPRADSTKSSVKSLRSRAAAVYSYQGLLSEIREFSGGKGVYSDRCFLMNAMLAYSEPKIYCA